MAKKDLFDDSTMTFGEHLEVLRFHLWKAIVGLVIGTVAAFFFSNYVIVAIQRPVTEAMSKYTNKTPETIDKSLVQSFKDWWTSLSRSGTNSAAAGADKEVDPAMIIPIDARDLLTQLHEIAPQSFPLPEESAKPASINVSLENTELWKLIAHLRDENLIPRTDGPDEAFMIYMKVSLIVGVIISGPWILYQLWLFIGAGLYTHERRYVYTYFPMSVGLFLGGAALCFFVVIPIVLQFLFGFNDWLHLRPEIKMSTWITFALMVSVMFGVSFQLPLVMLFLERISLVNIKLYREKRRHAILIIAFISMVLTPSDPVSMMLMMVPLCILYELGILLCARGAGAAKSPFEAQPA
ncbi:MAG: twin-arginine translocase subunit TatC [Deltaproteobacteria bacterium]